MALSEKTKKKLFSFQENEITEYHIYRRLARAASSGENRKTLERIASDELRHHDRWKRYTGRQAAPRRFKIWKYYLISRFIGLTFGVKLMEMGEEDAQDNYEELRDELHDIEEVIREEQEHEKELIALIDEEKLRYIGSIVLGLNDALVELTGALAGLTLALRNTRLVALTGLITGLAAALSMGVSEYLSTKTEADDRKPARAALYTGGTYVLTVLVLILPYLVLADYMVCLALSLSAAIAVVALFNYYIAVAKDLSFKKQFSEMAGLSLGVAAFGFVLGYALRFFFGIEA